eukprot:TRINITY_DN6395_c0_g1_i1.p1 TRINITY_DN6395_c0_g1~~TRINITY_DN6395_c0_g1_i1.p1  ORF type:complete len:282 (+),score=56.63 TRINITY_DN6395_c0_g1_i1:137-982(+)
MANTFLSPIVDKLTFGLTTWYEEKYADFELTQDGAEFLDTYFYWILACAVGYLPVIFALQAAMQSRKPFQLKRVLFAWNVALVVFNLYSMYYLVPRVVSYAFRGQFYTQSCKADPTFLKGPSSHAVMLFALSKVPEMLDTVFLVLRKRPVIFLHWFHHITVMLYCWSVLYSPQSNIDEGTEGAIFGAINSVVHVIMYSYYAARVVGYKPPGAMFITTIQLAQMVVGASVAGYRVFMCDNITRTWHARAGVAMYGCYFYLFGEFFVRRYMLPRAAVAAKKIE